MNNIRKMIGIAALLIGMPTLLAQPAMAQRQGGGNNPAGTLFVFDNVASVNGKTPKWSGDFTIGPPTSLYYGASPITHLSFSIRAKDLNFPDGTQLFVSISTSDIITGSSMDTSSVRYHCMASPMQVTGQLGIVKAYTDFYDDPAANIIRKLDKMVITDASGKVLAVAHP
jgi:hypothetical protein